MADSIKVVNMIPASLSAETNQDSEPNLAVNPENPMQIAGTAFTPNPDATSSVRFTRKSSRSNSPIYYSDDGGNTWNLLEIIAGTPVRDQTLRFATKGGRLYAGVLWGTGGVTGKDISKINFDILRTNDFTGTNVMTRLARRQNDDQPFVQAATTTSGADAGKDRVYIGSSDWAVSNIPATIDQSTDAAIPSPVFSTIRLEARTVTRDGYQIRPAIHRDGTVYAVFYAWIAGSASSDVVIVRDDNWGIGSNPFNALVDSSDNKQGVRIVTGRNVPNVGSSIYYGQQRIVGDLSIAVDPNNSSTVYVCWADLGLQGGSYKLHVRKSTDRGATWSGDLRTVKNAINPALAINSQGRVGLVFQKLTGVSPFQRWKTTIELTTDDFGSFDSYVLADTPANSPTATFDPYLGDYIYMMAVGRRFYGIFCANNTPDKANFPSGVTYQRIADWENKILKDSFGNTVAVSIDPFFFQVSSKRSKEVKVEIKEVLFDKPIKADILYKLVDEGWQKWIEYESEAIRLIAQRIDDIEERLPTAQAFIEPSERPQVEQAPVSKKSVAKRSAQARRKKGASKKE